MIQYLMISSFRLSSLCTVCGGSFQKLDLYKGFWRVEKGLLPQKHAETVTRGSNKLSASIRGF